MRLQRVALVVAWWVRRYGLGLLRDLAAISAAAALILLFVHAQATWTPPPPAGPVICGNQTILGAGPTSPPPGFFTVPAGDNSNLTPNFANPGFSVPGMKFWFAPGVHTVGNDAFAQIIPGANTIFTGAPGAVIDGQKINNYAFTGGAANVTITYLTIQNFGPVGGDRDAGVTNHDQGVGWTFQYDTFRGNAGAAVFLGNSNSITYTCLKDNEQYGLQDFGAGAVIDHDDFDHNDSYDWEVVIPACGCTGAAKFWTANGGTVTNNYVHDNLSWGFFADTNDVALDFENNYIAGNQGVGLQYEISYNARIVNNTFIDNAWGAGAENAGFPVSAVYISESGSDSRASATYGTSMDITGNKFIDNWSGVVLWENADRYCSSPANTSTGVCTLVNPTLEADCSTPGTQQVYPPCECADQAHLVTTPYIDDCRWKTQNVNVSGNVFEFNPADIGSSCTAGSYCGTNALFSNFGSFTPYTGSFVPNNITYNQNNHFSNNTYVGPWKWDTFNQGEIVDRATWQAAPSSQDAGSTFDGGGAPVTKGGWPGPVQPPVTVPGRPGRS